MLLHMLGLKRCGRNSTRQMFSTDELYEEKWLKQLTTRIKFEAFLRQVHWEDSADPTGLKFPAVSTDYRPNGVPKVGLLLSSFRRRCVLFRPERILSFDEATAKYGGRMTHLKHLQSKYKPYDGIRIYSLNGAKTGYTQNFRVDLRDGTSIETMFRGILTPFEGCGYNVRRQCFHDGRDAQTHKGGRHQLRRNNPSHLRVPGIPRRPRTASGAMDVGYDSSWSTCRLLE